MTMQRRRFFDGVSTALVIGHAVAAVGALAGGVLILVEESPLKVSLGMVTRPVEIGLYSLLALHALLMLAMPLWSGLAARGQAGVSRLWAWLGYFIPLASYWLPAQTLQRLAMPRLADGADAEAPRRRMLIVAWGVARGVASPSFFVALVLVMLKMGTDSGMSGWIVIIYIFVAIFAANFLSLLMISQMRRHLLAATVDERHAEVFS